jgi:maltose/maltodextrin transport system substrate-binding protein/arabinogalactan oligomer/maltooligosaccharide transport system substrate-binding protein
MRNRIFLFILAAMLVALVGGQVLAQDELVIWADDTRSPVLMELGAQFEAEYGIPVVVQELAFGDIRDQLKTAGPAGEGPDIIVGAHDWLGELVTNGLLEPVAMDEDMVAQFAPAAIDAFTFNGTLYGLPVTTENVAFIYNPELVPEAPASWDDVMSISQALVDEGKSKYGYIRQDGDPYHFFPIQTAFGGYVFGRDEDGNYLADDLGVDSEGAIAALTWYQGMVEAGLQPTGVDYDVMHGLFEAGDAAMIITGPWALERIRTAGVPYAVSVIPAGPDGTTAKPFFGAQGFMISAFSEQKELAAAFLLDFVASEEVTVTVTLGEGDAATEVTATPMEIFGQSRPSAFLPALAKAEDPDFPAFAEAGAEALPMPSIPEMSSVWSAWGDAVTLVTQGGAAADEAFTTAAEQIRTLINEGS